MKYLLTLILAIFSLQAFAHSGHIYGPNVLKVYAEEDFIPFNYKDKNGILKGASVEIVEKILESAKFKHTNIKVAPWARAYYLSQHQPNTLLFSIYRTPPREKLFDWVGPIGTSKLVILMRKGFTPKDKNFSVAAVRASASLQATKDLVADHDRIVLLNEAPLGAKLLQRRRVDAWSVSFISAKREIEKQGLSMDDFYIYKTLSEHDIYFALNKNTKEEVKNHFYEKLEELKKSGFIHKVLKKYNIE